MTIRFLNQDPEWQAAQEVLRRARTDLEAIEAEIKTQRGERADYLATMKGRVQSAAEKYLEDGELDHREPYVAPAPQDRDLADLNAKRRQLHEAIEIQKRRIGEIENRVNRRIAETRRPEYVDWVSRTLDAMLDLAALGDEGRKWRGDLEATGTSVDGYLPPHPVPFLGSPADIDSVVCIWLREAVRLGLLSPDDPRLTDTNWDGERVKCGKRDPDKGVQGKKAA